PRPPALEPVRSRLRVVVDGVVVADTTRGFRVLETSQPPAYYLPPTDLAAAHLEPSTARSFCEWKGQARYWTIVVGDRVIPDAAWSYAPPTGRFPGSPDHLAFYPQKVDACYVDDELVQANEGGFYGGWITSRIVG